MFCGALCSDVRLEAGARPWCVPSEGGGSARRPTEAARGFAARAGGGADREDGDIRPRHPSRLTYPSAPPFMPTRLLPKARKMEKRTERMLELLDSEFKARMHAERPIVDVRTGDIVEVHSVVPENRNRVSVFSGMVLAVRHRGAGTAFIVRGAVGGVPVERTFPVYAPTLREVKVVRRKKTPGRPDSKLYSERLPKSRNR